MTKPTKIRAAARAIDNLGGPSELARRLGLKPNVVSNWKARGVPVRYAYLIAEWAGVQPAAISPDWVRA